MKKLIIIITILILVLAGAFAYWYFFFRISIDTIPDDGSANPADSGFIPFDRPGIGTGRGTGGATTTGTGTTQGDVPMRIPALRQLSATPIGGYSASTTASTTVVRWVDRGRGNIYEAGMDSVTIKTISNTLLPKVYESWWNKNNTTFIGQYMAGDSDAVTTVIANIIKRPSITTSSGTSSPNIQNPSETIYELKGKIVSGNVIGTASSPKRDRILVITNENNNAVGYISNFDGSKQVQIFSLPFVQLVVEWPEENTIAITTKAGASYPGYLYFINTKTGVVKSILGNIPGLITKVSKDANKVLYSSGDNNNISTALFDVKTKKTSLVIFKTLADKCVWSSTFKENIYCGVSSQIPNGTYPDTWYLGINSFIDSVWALNSKDGDVRQVADLLNQNSVIIDIINPSLSEDENYLFFMNKNDMSLWSLDLVASN
ncbi:MAG: hypothetical protein WCW03_01350 [Candidatus Paceibacterota bacterium]|jgi:hypothetical protein